MRNNSYFGGIIWTNHALDRLKERGMSRDIAIQAFKNPDNKKDGKQSGTYEFQKKIGNSYVTIIARRNVKQEWIMLSCWIDPPIYGTRDWKEKQYYKAYQKAGLFGKLWIIFKRQIGI